VPKSHYSPGFDPSILRHSEIRGATDEAVLIKYIKNPKNHLFVTVTTGIVDTGGKLTSGVVETGGTFAASVTTIIAILERCDYLCCCYRVVNLPLVSRKPAVIFPPVSNTTQAVHLDLHICICELPEKIEMALRELLTGAGGDSP
jgi:hypothetical protein